MLSRGRGGSKNVQYSREIFVDNFAGGGGASTGIELATGRSVDIAINHDPAAIAMHRANHPETEHYCESVWDVDPREVPRGDQSTKCDYYTPHVNWPRFVKGE
jgi:DNA (cytosine-5)-methyltransferase 1